MKTLIVVLGIVVAASTISCNLNNELARPNLANQIAGTYDGTLTSALSQNGVKATAEIKSDNDYSIQVRCYSVDFDTTFMLNLYQDGNMMRVCASGEDFQRAYGHGMPGNSQMMGSSGMMGGSGSWTSWQQHMITEHTTKDMHYGYFNMNTKTFHYAFTSASSEGDSSEMHFNGMR